ncbi:MAG: DEAD/DEAH box helicase [Candidatus Paceibacterota bacterium]|jgi:superfamily II DNA/RNA helicase
MNHKTFRKQNGFGFRSSEDHSGSFHSKRSQSSFKKRPSFKRKRSGFAKKIDVSMFIQNNTVVDQEIIYSPKNKFIDFKIDSRLKNNVIRKGYQNPTPIQDQTIPLVLENKDVVGVANTGTGKTAAFLLPTINKVLLNKKEKIIILVPTRELALQIEKEFKEFTVGLSIFSVVCIGGTNIKKQFFDLRTNHNFIIGTPGRVKDLVQRKSLNLSVFKTVILDEADRMLDMGFIDDIKFLMSKMPENKQALCFSATVPSEIEILINEFLKNPIKISVKSRESSANVSQDIIRVPDQKKKTETLCQLLIKQEFSKVLIFGKTKFGVERLSRTLVEKGFQAVSIHGDKNQSKREKALNSFRKDQVKILVATDVAARGLDINDISHVINYDLPATYDDYVHRIGRTGRGSKKGIAITFV